MASKSETSFGARLRQAQDLATYIAGFANYSPPRPEETLDDFQKLLNTLVEANSNVNTALQNYNTAVTNRYKAFRQDDLSLFKLLAPIRGVILAQYGKESIEANQANTIISKIRASKLIKTPATDTTPEIKISQSEQSYGSSTQFFNDLINTLQTFRDYKPSKTELQLPQLQAFQTNLDNLNNAVATNYQKNKQTRETRRTLYEELADRAARIKAYVKGNYGTQSPEYTLIKGLKI